MNQPVNERYLVKRRLIPQVSTLFLAEKGGEEFVLKYEGEEDMEYTALSRLDHANIVRLIDRIEAKDPIWRIFEGISRGKLLVLERVGGKDLARHKKPMDSERVISYAMQTAGALSHVVGRGFVHSDVSSLNLIADNGKVTLVDFDMAAPAPEAGSLGPFYGLNYNFAPLEQIFLGVSRNSDVYSLGVVIYELLHPNINSVPPVKVTRDSVGRFTGLFESPEDCFQQVVSGRYFDPRATLGVFGSQDAAELVNPQLDAHPRFRVVLESMLELDYRNRPQIEEVQYELEQI